MNKKELIEMGQKVKIAIKDMFVYNLEDFESFYGKSYFFTTEKVNLFFHLDGYNKLSIINRKKGQSYYIDLNDFSITSNKVIEKSDLQFIYNTFYMLYENMSMKTYSSTSYGKMKHRLHNNLIVKYYQNIFDRFKRSELRKIS